MISFIFRFGFVFAFAIFLTNCSVRYTKRIPGFQPGYTDQQLGDSTYQVKIGEAWPKDWADLEKFALYRAADVTNSKGQRYFAIIDADEFQTTYNITTPTTHSTSATSRTIGNTTFINATTVTHPGVTGSISGGWFILDYKIINESDVKLYRKVVDSNQVLSDYKHFIDRRR